MLAVRCGVTFSSCMLQKSVNDDGSTRTRTRRHTQKNAPKRARAVTAQCLPWLNEAPGHRTAWRRFCVGGRRNRGKPARRTTNDLLACTVYS